MPTVPDLGAKAHQPHEEHAAGWEKCVVQVSWLALRSRMLHGPSTYLPREISPVADFRPMNPHFGLGLALTVPVAWVLTPFI